MRSTKSSRNVRCENKPVELFEQLEARQLMSVAVTPWDGSVGSRVMVPGYEVKNNGGKGHNKPTPPPAPTPTPPPNPAVTILSNPSDYSAGNSYDASYTLWGNGGTPIPTDVNQYQISDCWLLCELQSMAANNPTKLMNSIKPDAVNTGYMDITIYGTLYAIPPGFSQQQSYAGYSHATWSIWLEKALACYDGSYAALNGGWMTTAVSAFGWTADSFVLSTPANLAATFDADASHHEGITIGTLSSGDGAVVASHGYYLAGYTLSSDGVYTFHLENPWGFNDAYITGANWNDLISTAVGSY